MCDDPTPIQRARLFLQNNIPKGWQESGARADAEMVLAVEKIMDGQPTFLVQQQGDDEELCSRREMLNNHPFEEHNMQPEDVFEPLTVLLYIVMNEDGEFEEHYGLQMGEGEKQLPPPVVAAQKWGGAGCEPDQKIPTHVHRSSERWEDFLMLQRFARSLRTFAPQLGYFKGPLGALAAPVQRGGDRAIEDTADKPESSSN
jgi:hypothetical protein